MAVDPATACEECGISRSCPISTDSIYWALAVIPEQRFSREILCATQVSYLVLIRVSGQGLAQPTLQCPNPAHFLHTFPQVQLIHTPIAPSFSFPLRTYVASLTHHHYHSSITRNSGSRHEKHGFTLVFLEIWLLKAPNIQCFLWILGTGVLEPKCQSQLGPSTGGKVIFF